VEKTNQAVIVEDDTGTLAGASTEAAAICTSLPTPEGSSEASKHASLFCESVIESF
jgi:hypothetical protein